jgi:adsorption protein B
METIETIFLVLTYIAALGFLVIGLDDLVFDSQFIGCLWRRRRQPKLTFQQLKLAPEQWIALWVPAWQEGGVVTQMADYATRVLRYEKYDLFIGVHPNDPETNACVDDLCAVNPRIHKVALPHPGPTSKADCLNWIYRAMKDREVPRVREYQIVALHEPEDVLHPLALKVYNATVPRDYDVAQLPVLAIEFPVWTHWTANTYVDECAELHTKDLLIRQSLGGLAPAAGARIAFSRAALDRLAAENGGDPFRPGQGAKDYETGLRVKRAGLRAGLAHCVVEREVRPRGADGALGPPKHQRELVAVRKTFPQSFGAAVRQRADWMLGRALHKREPSGRAGSLPMRYTLLRDRRAPLTHVVLALGYAALSYWCVTWAWPWTPWAADVPLRVPLAPDSWLWKVLVVDAWLAAYRGLQRFLSVANFYGVRQAAFSLPRCVVGHWVNFAATLTAATIFLIHKLRGRPVAGRKPARVFPGATDLAEYGKTIEDLLLESGLATRAQLAHALKLEETASAPLALLRLGLLDEDQFTDLWARHAGLPVRFINPYHIHLQALQRLPEQQAQDFNVLPFEEKVDHVLVAFLEAPSDSRLAEVSRAMGAAVRPVLARPSNLAFARHHAYPGLVLPARRMAGHLERFREAAHQTPDAFLELLSRQHASRQSLPDVLVNRGLLTEPQARRLWAEVLECAPADSSEFQLDEELYRQIGPAFWWFHRLVPVTIEVVATAGPPHPQLAEWLARKVGASVDFVADLPGRVELTVELNPDQLLIERLVQKRLLKERDRPKLEAARAIIADPMPKWLALQRLVTEQDLHEAFLDICQLPPASPWTAGEVRRLRPVLPPGFAREHGVFVLEETQGALRLGLTQMLAPAALRDLHDRLSGYPVFFQALSFEEAVALHGLDAE